MGSDKFDLCLRGETLLERTARVLAEVADEVLVVGLPAGRAVPAGARAVADAVEDGGPLAGLVAGLRTMRQPRAAVAACDLPFLRSSVLAYLLDALGDSDAAVPVVAGFPQPACAAYAKSALSAAESLLHRDRRSMTRLLDELTVEYVGEEALRQIDPALRSFRDVDTPEEWAAIVNA
jgi:molybdopterin-guanine dinucleotide biosynthesis protein A